MNRQRLEIIRSSKPTTSPTLFYLRDSKLSLNITKLRACHASPDDINTTSLQGCSRIARDSDTAVASTEVAH